MRSSNSASSWVLVCLGLLLAGIQGASAKVGLSYPVADFTAGYELQVLAVRVDLSPTAIAANGGFNIGAGDTVELTYSTGATVTATIGPGNHLRVPPPPIPPGAEDLGNSLTVTFTTSSGPSFTSKPLRWYDSEWTVVTPGIKVDPQGIPGLTATQSWFIDEIEAEISGDIPGFGQATAKIWDSNFDLAYTDLGGNTYEARVVGDDSFIHLFDPETYIAFPENTVFGTTTILFNDGATAHGAFDFHAVGLAGTWEWDASSDYTGGVTTDVTSFVAPALTSSEPPAMPAHSLAGLVALMLLLLTLVAVRVRRSLDWTRRDP